MREFLRLDNKLTLKLKIKPVSPLNIKLGADTKNVVALLTTESSSETKIDVEKGDIIQDRREGEIYIPGSTLKGLFKNRFIIMNGGEKKKEEDPAIKNLFGYSEDDNSLKGRIFLQDAYFADEKLRKEIYENVRELKEFIKTRAITPIDHFTGKVKDPLKFEYTVEEFLTEIIVNNVTLDELQKLFFVVRDSKLGEIRIGNSKTRGFGEIAFEIEELRFDNYIGKNSFFEPLKQYFTRDIDNSIKIGNKYLCESMVLQKEYKNIDVENKSEVKEPNNFIKALFKEVK